MKKVTNLIFAISLIALTTLSHTVISSSGEKLKLLNHSDYTNIFSTDDEYSNTEVTLLQTAIDCEYTIELWDDYGDGWNGGSLSVYVDDDLVLQNITLLTGYGPEVFTFIATDGASIVFEYSFGAWAYENEYFVYDHSGELVFSDGVGSSVPTGGQIIGNCEIPECSEPTALAATDLTTTSALLGWTPGGDEELWNVEVGLTGFEPGTASALFTYSGVVTNTLEVTDLDPATTYEFYVQADCGNGDRIVSDWAVPLAFTTLCEAFDLPWCESFDDVTAPTIPNCMSVVNANNDLYPWETYSSGANSDPNAMSIRWNSSLAMDDWFFSPGLNLTGGDTYKVDFYYKSGSDFYNEALKVMWGSAPGPDAMFVDPIWDNNNITNTDYELGSGTFTPDEDGVYYLGWHGYSDADMLRLYVDDICVDVMVMPVQNILLPEGWSGWSAYIDPMMDAMFEDVVDDVVGDMIITQYFTDVFYPAYSINTMGEFSNAHGYVTKMTTEAVLTLEGMMVDPTVDFVSGWNLMPMLVDCNLAAADVFGGITGFVIAYEVAGAGIYWPGNTITLETLVPGKAYWVKVDSPSEYTFPECAPDAKANFIAPLRHSNTTDWNEVSYTGLSHVVVFDDYASVQFAPGDVIGAFTSNGTLAGMTIVNDKNASLAAFGEDITTAANDGFVDGEQLSFKLYRHANQTEYILDVNYSTKAPNYDGNFANHGMSIIDDMSMTATGISSSDLNGLSIYPNPSDGLFNVSVDDLTKDVSYVIMDAKGQMITEGKLAASQVIDLSDQPRGVYFIKFVGNDILRIEKLVLR